MPAMCWELSQCLEAKVGVSFGSRLGHALGVGVAQKQNFQCYLGKGNCEFSVRCESSGTARRNGGVSDVSCLQLAVETSSRP